MPVEQQMSKYHRENKEVLTLFKEAEEGRIKGNYSKSLEYIEKAIEMQPDNVSFVL
jgi:hypothetical protein